MSRFALPVVLAITAVLCFAMLGQSQDAAQPAATQPAAPDIDAMSYALGANLGRNIASQVLHGIAQRGVEINTDQLAKGIQDALTGHPSELNPAQIVAAMEIFDALMQAGQLQMMQKMQQTGEVNLTEGKAFLEQNAKAQGITTTASGLQYRILRPGSGATPKATDRVLAHYEGKLLNGSVFDSSYDRGEPVEFAVNLLVPGWTEALQLMKVGGKWELFLPAELGYGVQGSPGGRIGPNEVLHFTLELIDIVPGNAGP